METSSQDIRQGEKYRKQNLIPLKHDFCQTPVPSPDFSLGLGVDFVLPLSQQEEQEEQEEEQEPHQNIPEGNILKVFNLAISLTKPNQTHETPLLTYFLNKKSF